ncbi:MAG: PilZ domain-containing protein [Planctomycetes bacterium]|nr:PilZ domain-containing protein [Planctomycetota bacterium]
MRKSPDPVSKRSGKRWPYDSVGELRLEIEHPGGGISEFLVRPCNISAGGLSLEHGGFIARGTGCFITLKTSDGQPVRVHGSILGCRCVGGRIHDVGVKFEKSIDVARFVPEAQDDPDDVPDAAPILADSYDRELVLGVIGQLWEIATHHASLNELRYKVDELARLVHRD